MSEYKELPGPIEGYKIFNDDMTCRDFKFEIGKRNILPNDRPLELCGNGFHFCKHPSGVWAYYGGGRVFKIRAYGVLEASPEPGADYKLVAREIEILEEIFPDGNRNTGDGNTGNHNTGNHNTGSRNTGDRNTGSRNTGDRNTGNHNTGDRNTGYRNTGDGNTGYCNTGNRNTGDGNAGYRNTGHCNTGNHNTGDRNTGNHNTGNHNTGSWNCGNYHTGYFNLGEAPLYLFGKMTSTKREDLDFPLMQQLGEELSQDEPFDPTPFLALPNATKSYIKKLHKAMIEARKESKP